LRYHTAHQKLISKPVVSNKIFVSLGFLGIKLLGIRNYQESKQKYNVT